MFLVDGWFSAGTDHRCAFAVLSQEEPSSESSTDQVMLQPMGVSDEVVKVVAKDKLEQYQALYHKCVADYEEATNQVATLDDAIATLRTQIAAMESHQVASSSSVST